MRSTIFFLAFSVLACGCEAVVDFDRSKIDGGAKSAARIAETLGVSDGGVATPDTDADGADE